ncbi:RNA recognition motif-containing family protein [Striga asiatica]|uniref:RNA recognition motif-containing family protein n=1 Tax=Striga asiatica TaxID=4170 RepID=A0A5A7QIP8_STRAF|nr:RNA recognition motif-containing family protein [Striga asiatica]
MEGDKRTFRVDLTSEGASKLRDAIRVKLKEFMGDYTDDTLVEYVIVLLKNGRSKDEAKSELNVFLGDDSDSFVSWLWDHLGSNVSLYVQPQGLQSEGVSKTKPVPGNEAGNTETYEIQPKADKVNSVKSHRHRSNPPSKGLVRDRDDNEVLPQNSVDGIETSKNEWRVRPTSHKKRRGAEEQQPRKREVSQSTVSAPRRLLQFAVRDAVGTSRPSIAAESSRKRLRSVVSTSTGDLLPEERPQRIPRTFISVAIKAAAEAVEDVSKTRPSHNVFDRLGHTPDVPNTAYDQENERVAEVGDGDFGVATENFDSGYRPQNDGSMLQAVNMSPFHETILDSVLGDDGEDYDDIDDREPDATDVTRLGTSGRKWIDKSLAYEYDAAAEPIKGLGPPATRRNPSVRIASSVGLNTRKAQYGERDVSEMDTHKRSLSSATATKPEVRLLKVNSNPTPVSNGNAKPDMIQQQTEKTRAPTGLQNTGPPTDGADSRTIFVSNVHFAATKDSLSRHFNKFGEVLKVIILTDPVTGQPKGSAYIEFMRKEAAELALSLDGTSFMSRLLKIVRKNSVLPEVASITPRPRVLRASPYTVPRYSRVPFARGMPSSIYRSRVPMKPGTRSFQWKRGTESTANETSVNTNFPAPAIRGLTYVRPETKANGSSGTA